MIGAHRYLEQVEDSMPQSSIEGLPVIGGCPQVPLCIYPACIDVYAVVAAVAAVAV